MSALGRKRPSAPALASAFSIWRRDALGDAERSIVLEHVADRQTQDLGRRLGFFAHELRNHLTTATLAVNIIKSGNVGLSGATGKILDRSLSGLCQLIDRSLAEVRIASGPVIESQLFSLSGFIAELKVTASLEAAARNCPFIVASVDPDLEILGDRDLLLAAAGNLLQNAFKFTAAGTEVTLHGVATRRQRRCGTCGIGRTGSPLARRPIA